LIKVGGISSPIVPDKTAKHYEGIESSEMIATVFNPEIKTLRPSLFSGLLKQLRFDILKHYEHPNLPLGD
jgi:hypothetical protein